MHPVICQIFCFTVLGQSWNHHPSCGSQAYVVMYQCYEGQTARPDIDRERRLSAQDYVCALQTQHLIVINRTFPQISDEVINIFWTVSYFKSNRNILKCYVHWTSHNMKRWYFRKCSKSESSLFWGRGGCLWKLSNWFNEIICSISIQKVTYCTCKA